MNNLYNKRLCDPTVVGEWQALERIKAEAYEKGYADGFNSGRERGFRAGFTAATEQPAAKIEAAYEQGMKKVLDSR